jgi:hypothetical protein
MRKDTRSFLLISRVTLYSQEIMMLFGNAPTVDTLLLARELLRFVLFALIHRLILKSRLKTINS